MAFGTSEFMDTFGAELTAIGLLFPIMFAIQQSKFIEGTLEEIGAMILNWAILVAMKHNVLVRFRNAIDHENEARARVARRTGTFQRALDATMRGRRRRQRVETGDGGPTTAAAAATTTTTREGRRRHPDAPAKSTPWYINTLLNIYVLYVRAIGLTLIGTLSRNVASMSTGNPILWTGTFIAVVVGAGIAVFGPRN
jgi:hypothetical protein